MESQPRSLQRLHVLDSRVPEGEAREFSLSRKFTSLQHILPLKAVAQARPLGELNPRTGQLNIHPSIELIIKKYKVWTDFSPNCH